MNDRREVITYGFKYSAGEQNGRAFFTIVLKADEEVGELTIGGPGSGYFRELTTREYEKAIAELLEEADIVAIDKGRVEDNAFVVKVSRAVIEVRA